MKNKGYTLAESLIALGIVGIVAALMLPMVNKFKPDNTKVTYLKTYDSLVESVNMIAANKTFYPKFNTDDTGAYEGILYSNYPLYNKIAVENGELTFSEGEQKLCEILATTFGVPKSEIACTNSDLTASNASFNLKNGSSFIVKTTTKTPSAYKGEYKTEILFDANGLNKGKNSTYSDTVEEPDQFKFVVYANGLVVPADKKGQSYLTKRSNWKKTENDTDNLTYMGEDSTLEKFDLEYYN